MAIQWMDNFGWCGTGSTSLTYLLSGTPYTLLSGATGFPNGVIADPVISGAYCLQVGQNLGNYYNADNQVALPTPANAIGVALRWYMSGGSGRSIIQWQDVGGNILFGLQNEINGALSIYGPGAFGGSQLATTTVPVLTFNTWWHIEAMVDYALGKITVFVEGTQVLVYSFTEVPSPIIYNIGFSPRTGLGSPGGTILMKDYVIYDKSGTQNNTVGSIGPCTVYRLALNSDVSNGWTITGAASVNAAIGGEPPADSTSYIAAGYGPFPAPAVCGIASLPTTVVAVRGVMSLQRTKKSDGGVASFQVNLKSGSSTHTGTTHNPATSYNYSWDVVELDPATGALWTPIAVDNMNVQLNRTI